jgi:hypothetical protein
MSSTNPDCEEEVLEGKNVAGLRDCKVIIYFGIWYEA